MGAQLRRSVGEYFLNEVLVGGPLVGVDLLVSTLLSRSLSLPPPKSFALLALRPGENRGLLNILRSGEDRLLLFALSSLVVEAGVATSQSVLAGVKGGMDGCRYWYLLLLLPRRRSDALLVRTTTV